jgi:hypothetical protein
MAFINAEQSKIDKEKKYQKLKKQMMNMEVTKCTVRIPTHLYKELKRKLLHNDKTVNGFIMNKVLKYLGKLD